MRARGKQAVGPVTGRKRRDLTIRKEILWESDCATDSEVSRMEVQLIRQLRANDPEVG